MKNIFKSSWFKVLLMVVIAVVALFQFRETKIESEQVYVVGEHDVEQVVLLSGAVKAVGQVDLSFDASGKVAVIAVAQGDLVEEGDMLAELDYGTLKADLQQAYGSVQSTQSSVSLAKASVQKAEANLALVQAQNRGTDSSISAAESVLTNTILEQETLVQNAYTELLNNDLTAYPVDNYKNVAVPVVSGSYTAETTGEYKLDFYGSGARTGYSIRVSGLSSGTISFDDFGIPETIGNAGLYLTLPTAGESDVYSSTDWVIPVPNNRSATYQTKLGAYEKAQQTQTLMVAKAQSSLDTLIAQQESGENVAITTAQEQQAAAAIQEAEANLSQVYGALAQAQAGVAKVQAQIENNIIYAPFSGTVARLDFEVGRSVTPGYAGVTIVTDGENELVMSIPEIDVAKVQVGDASEIILDAYGAGVVWSGVLSEIDLVETEVDGVPTYSSVITMLEVDERIKIGMNARARIVVSEKVGVVAIPSSYIVTTDGTSVVLVKLNERQNEERVVSTGLVGTDYFVEVTAGLASGDILLAPSDK